MVISTRELTRITKLVEIFDPKYMCRKMWVKKGEKKKKTGTPYTKKGDGNSLITIFTN